MQTKYTNDGKKVAIVGKLNADQTIVQEIFITENGQEIPSGENFVVTSLHDQPVKKWSTYYENKCKETEKMYESQLKSIENNYRSARKKAEYLYEAAKTIQALSNGFDKAMQQVANLFDPKNEWFVYKKYGDLYVVPYAEYIASESLWISIGNSSNKGVIVCLKNGSDNMDEFSLFETKEQALDFWVEKVSEKDHLSHRDVTFIEKTPEIKINQKIREMMAHYDGTEMRKKIEAIQKLESQLANLYDGFDMEKFNVAPIFSRR